jgi:altronate hydrolase
VPEFCGAEHLLASRAKDVETGRAVYRLVDWYKEYASKFGAVLNNNPSPGNVAGGLLNITIKSLGAIAKAGTTRVEGVIEYAETPTQRGLNLMQGPGYDQESTPGLVVRARRSSFSQPDAGPRSATRSRRLSSWRRTRRCSNACRTISIFPPAVSSTEPETIDEVGKRVFDRVVEVAGGLQAKAEEHKHREFQFWAEQTVSL